MWYGRTKEMENSRADQKRRLGVCSTYTNYFRRVRRLGDRGGGRWNFSLYSSSSSPLGCLFFAAENIKSAKRDIFSAQKGKKGVGEKKKNVLRRVARFLAAAFLPSTRFSNAWSSAPCLRLSSSTYIKPANQSGGARHASQNKNKKKSPYRLKLVQLRVGLIRRLVRACLCVFILIFKFSKNVVCGGVGGIP